jgi:uncharacterized protein YggE
MRQILRSAFVLSVCASAGAAAQAPPTSAFGSQVVTTGVGEARVVPDRATIFIGVQSRAPTAAAAGADNARRQRAILDTLRAVGLNAEQLGTINYNVTPEMQYNPNGGTPRVTGYVVTNTVRAELRRIDDVGRVIDAALAKGANEISSLQFTSSKADSVRRAALAEAVVNARADAEALARAAGGSLGALLELSTTSIPIRPMMEMSMAKTAMAAPRTPIDPGEQVINASVTARWAFVPR